MITGCHKAKSLIALDTSSKLVKRQRARVHVDHLSWPNAQALLRTVAKALGSGLITVSGKSSGNAKSGVMSPECLQFGGVGLLMIFKHTVVESIC